MFVAGFKFLGCKNTSAWRLQGNTGQPWYTGFSGQIV